MNLHNICLPGPALPSELARFPQQQQQRPAGAWWQGRMGWSLPGGQETRPVWGFFPGCISLGSLGRKCCCCCQRSLWLSLQRGLAWVGPWPAAPAHPLVPGLVCRQKTLCVWGLSVGCGLGSGAQCCNWFWKEQHSLSWDCRWGVAVRWRIPLDLAVSKQWVVSVRPFCSTPL